VRRIFDAADRYEELRGWLTAQWKLPESQRDAAATEIFGELALDAAAGTRRQLYESERFRDLLETPLERAA
jgi:hypothetical protein